MNLLACAIIEDQRPAQKLLEKYIADADYLELVGVYSSAAEAAHSLPATCADILLLDLHLPKMDGFTFLKALARPPLVIVTTADTDQALEGYVHNVVDYLLKPFSFERFLQAIEKARPRHGGVSSGASQLAGQSGSKDLFVKSKGEIHRIPIEEIEFVRADNDYVEVFTSTAKYFFASTLSALKNELPDHLFVRVHKSHIVNIRRITRIVGAEIYVGGTTVPMGRSYREGFLIKIGAK
ncbi:MAG: LytTR family DNA-binding domain-containing protein [Pseudomonadota bacterium]